MVKAGYKETEIGVIPADWEVQSFSIVGDFFKGSGISMKDVVVSGYPCIMYGDIYVKFNTHFDKCDFHITAQTAANSTRAKHGDLFFTASGETAEEIGKCVSYQGESDIFIGGDIIAVRPSSEYDSLFLAYVQNSASLINQKASFAQGCSVVHISGDNIKKLVFASPSLPEQRRIAEALSDVDALIANLEKLIAKKKAIKQGAMQLLLTGKKRLPDFTGEWVEKALQDIADNITMGQSPDSFFYNLNMRGLPLIQGNADIAERKTIVRFYSSQITRRGYTGDIIMTVRAPVGSVAKATFDCCLGRGVCAIKGNDFLYHLLVYSEPKWGTLSTGSTFDSISGNELRDVKFLIPVDDKEQATIAAILTDMDKEINDLSAKLLKYRNIKIGMMQTLLTGKIRLTEPDTPAVVIHIPKDEALPKSAEKPHNQQFDDAVAIAAIVDAFYSGKYPLGRKKVQKLLYLLRRRQEVSTAAFKKKAAGPYADEVRYKGGEPIATRNDYITVNKSNQGSMFSKGKIIQKALEYVAKWEMQPDVDWLVAQFLHTPVNQLELLATIDMAMCDLESRGITASVDSVKKLIASDKEWRAKLKKTYFSDDDIGWAITECLGLFNSTGR